MSSATAASAAASAAAATVAEDGYLLYSTCTFSEEENEDNVTAFLAAHPEFSLVPVSERVRLVTADGIVRAGRPPSIALSRRFYPHRAAGEGQFLALMQNLFVKFAFHILSQILLLIL